MKAAALGALALAGGALAQDPAPGWLSYAMFTAPSSYGRMTYFSGKWKVPANPAAGGAFYSPWIGAGTTARDCLIQPVNPWMGGSMASEEEVENSSTSSTTTGGGSGGSDWSAYCEYYQWSNGYNQNSPSFPVTAGDEMFGEMILNSDQASYTIRQTDTTTGKTVQMSIPIQADPSGGLKNYTTLYVVFEKVANCNQYPVGGFIEFSELSANFDAGTNLPLSWATSYVEDVCNFRAQAVNSSTVTMTWDTSASSLPADYIAASQKVAREQYMAAVASLPAALQKKYD